VNTIDLLIGSNIFGSISNEAWHSTWDLYSRQSLWAIDRTQSYPMSVRHAYRILSITACLVHILVSTHACIHSTAHSCPKGMNAAMGPLYGFRNVINQIPDLVPSFNYTLLQTTRSRQDKTRQPNQDVRPGRWEYNRRQKDRTLFTVRNSSYSGSTPKTDREWYVPLLPYVHEQ
jgi:hypothetical protein